MTAGDQKMVCASMERLGRAAKSQPPTALVFERQWRVVGLGSNESLIPTLILLLATETLPRQTFVHQMIEEVVTMMLSPSRSIGPHWSPLHVSHKSSKY
jgi:hypothetical protein